MSTLEHEDGVYAAKRARAAAFMAGRDFTPVVPLPPFDGGTKIASGTSALGGSSVPDALTLGEAA
jgi:hypothetical protein